MKRSAGVKMTVLMYFLDYGYYTERATGFLMTFKLPVQVCGSYGLKGAKDEVKRPEGPSTRSRGPEGP